MWKAWAQLVVGQEGWTVKCGVYLVRDWVGATRNKIKEMGRSFAADV